MTYLYNKDAETYHCGQVVRDVQDFDYEIVPLFFSYLVCLTYGLPLDKNLRVYGNFEVINGKDPMSNANQSRY